MKKLPLGLMSILLIFMLTLAACTAETTVSSNGTGSTADQAQAATDAQVTDTQVADTLPVFTLEELSKYNGKDGMAAYVGYEGKVYDVSNIKAWKNGIHQGKYEAGQDYTDVLNNLAPHAPTNLTDNAPIVGTLEQK